MMWIEELTGQINRRKAEITFSPHLFERQEYWNLELDNIEETVRTGKIVEEKCKKPNKLCLQRYFGKENITIVVIVKYHKEFIEVITAWLKKGR